MAKKKAMATVFSNTEINKFEELTQRIHDAQVQADGLARVIAGSLYMIKQKKLYEIESFKNIYEYGEQRHGISRGTVSDAINVFKRFGSRDNKLELAEPWGNYPWRSLVAMKSLDDNTITNLQLLPDTSSTIVIQRVKDYKEVEELLPGDGKWNWGDVKALIDGFDKIGVSENDDKTEEESASDSGEPADKEEAVQSNPPEPDYSQAIERASRMMTDSDYEEMRNKEGADFGKACEDYVEEFLEFPKRVIKITPDSDMKKLLADIKALLDGVTAGEYELIITT